MKQKKVKWLFSLLLILITTIAGYSQNNQKIIEFTIEGMTCQGCVNTATKTLTNVKGVDSVSVDLESKLAFVVTDNKVTKHDLKKALDTETNFEVLFPGEKLLLPLTDKEKEGLDIATIKGGGKLNFKEHLTEGKITIFDFYADWCGPCKVFSPKAERLLLQYDNVALRKVDLVDWKSDLANQLTQDYQLPALPFTLIFDSNGKFLGKVEGNNIEKVHELIQGE